MRYLCLIYIDHEQLGAMPDAEINRLNARHLAFNDAILDSGHFIEAEALQAPGSTATVRLRSGTTVVTDGPYVETKEQVAGFYLIDARDLNEAIQIASRIPFAPIATIEVRPCRDLVVDGAARKASRKTP